MQQPNSLLDDPRSIAAIFWGESFCAVTGDITAIVAYHEPGEMGYVPWFAIYEGEHIRYRIPARNYGVEYVKGGPDGR